MILFARVLAVVDIALQLVEYLIFIWVVLSWILFFARQSKFRWRNPQFFHVLEQLDDIFSRMAYPFLKPFRRLLRRWDTAGIDWSPMLLILVIILLRQLVLYGEVLIISGKVSGG